MVDTGPCEESEHIWAREELAIALPHLDGRIRHFESERCTKCGAIRRARDVNGDLTPEVGGDDEEWHEA